MAAHRTYTTGDPQVEIGGPGQEDPQKKAPGALGLDLDGLKNGFAELVSQLTKGSRGRIFVEVAQQLGYATDPQALEAAYERNPEAIEAMFDHLDTRKLLRVLMQQEGEESAAGNRITKRDGVAFAGGILSSVLAQKIFDL